MEELKLEALVSLNMNLKMVNKFNSNTEMQNYERL